MYVSYKSKGVRFYDNTKKNLKEMVENIYRLECFNIHGI